MSSLKPHDRQPAVSVIVPMRNGAEHVRQLVATLAQQSLPSQLFELVVADDGSTDGSTEWLGTVETINVRITSGEPRNSYAARNRAVTFARAPVLAFCDVDCRPEPEWLERGLAALQTTDIVAGRVRFVVPEHRTVWTLLDMDGSKDHEREVRNRTAETANLFLRTELFRRVGGFEEEVPEYGDFDFVERATDLGATLSFGSDVVVWHPTRDSARPFLRSQWIYSRGFGMREGRAGRVPQDLRVKQLIPVIPQLRARRWWGRSYGPDRKWLGENDVSPTTTEVLKALPLMYVALPYFRALAQLQGWLEGRRLSEAGPAERSVDRQGHAATAVDRVGDAEP
jgi:glycosyltransferase involved in cell wall biosynthesis